jgi:hypothetical protein
MRYLAHSAFLLLAIILLVGTYFYLTGTDPVLEDGGETTTVSEEVVLDERGNDCPDIPINFLVDELFALLSEKPEAFLNYEQTPEFGVTLLDYSYVTMSGEIFLSMNVFRSEKDEELVGILFCTSTVDLCGHDKARDPYTYIDKGPNGCVDVTIRNSPCSRSINDCTARNRDDVQGEFEPDQTRYENAWNLTQNFLTLHGRSPLPD